MAENSKIAWTKHTFNPWWGCLKVGPGCDNCYASDLDKRTGGHYWDGKTLPRRTKPANWNKPLKWNKEAEAAGERCEVFCASMADVFDNRVPKRWRTDLWALVKATPWLNWIILTKRAGNIIKGLPEDWGDGYPNVWLIITVTDQKEADRDIPKLLKVPAALHGLSIEPQLGPITLWRWWLEKLGWVIQGGESGPKRRPFKIQWAVEIEASCFNYDVPYFLKQTHDENGRVDKDPILYGVKHQAIPDLKS